MLKNLKQWLKRLVVVKLQVKGGAADPSPPVGPAWELLVLISWSSVSNSARLKIKLAKLSWYKLPYIRQVI
jgi:hypothetical protein